MRDFIGNHFDATLALVAGSSGLIFFGPITSVITVLFIYRLASGE